MESLLVAYQIGAVLYVSKVTNKEEEEKKHQKNFVSNTYAFTMRVLDSVEMFKIIQVEYGVWVHTRYIDEISVVNKNNYTMTRMTHFLLNF